MSSVNSVSTPTQSGRRFHERRRMDGLVYVDLGPDNGAILIDLSEGGLSFQSVAPVSMDQTVPLKFKLPGDSNHIEGHAEVAWLNESQKSGGLRFVELSANALDQIRGFAGVLSAPEAGPALAANGAHSNSTPEVPKEGASANSAEESIAPETTVIPAEVSETFTNGETAQPPSPETPNPETNEALRTTETADQEVPLAEDPQASASPILEFIAEPDAAVAPAERLAAQFDAVSSAAPPITTAADNGASEPSLQDESEHNIDDAREAPASADPIGPNSEIHPEIPKTDARPEATVVLHSTSEIPPGARTAPAPQVAGRPAGVVRAPESTPRIPNPAAAPPPKPARMSSTDSSTLTSAQKRQRKPAPSKVESSPPPAHRQDSAVRGTFVRQIPKQPSAATEWESLAESQEDQSTLREMLSSQPLKIGIGAVAGASLVLALVAAVPFLRTRVQATANARSGGLDLTNTPPFQVEVADLNNRRWILRSGGEAASPFSETPSRSGGSNSARDSARSSRVKETDLRAPAADVQGVEEVAETPQPKLPNPAELVLSRPLAKPADAPSAQLLAPSIFDGITPPLGSLTDRLPASGPEVPGIVPPENPRSVRPSALQSAVLVQRVSPLYPAMALPSRVQGDVTVSATIGKDGVPKNLKAVKGDLRLIQAALAAISQWRYRPATLGGEPVETQTVVTVSFELK